MPTIKIADTPVASECVTLAEAKLHLKEDFTDNDLLIASLITAARQEAEHKMRRTLVHTHWELQLDGFPANGGMRLYNPPLQSVTYVNYYDATGTLQTLDPSFYVLDAASEPARLVLAPGKSWPTTYSRPGAVQVRYVAGLTEADKALVPEAIKAWIKMRVGDLFVQRGEVITGTLVQKAPFMDGLLDPYRVWGL